MTTRALELPNEVKSRLILQGEIGTRWVNDIARLIHDLEHDWDISVGAVLSGGSEALVAQATTADGTGAIIKLGIPGPTGFEQEVRTLLLADGNGYVRVLRHDNERRAMLQERLGAPLANLGLPVDRQIEIICTTLRRTWIAVPDAFPIQTGAEKARFLGEFIEKTWQEQGRPCSKRALDLARSFAASRERAYDHTTSVLVHGDAHSANTLRAAGTADLDAFKFVDPDGLRAERACDLAVPMRSWSEVLLEGDPLALGRARCEFIATLTGVTTESIWQWGFLERMSTGLHVLQLGSHAEGRDMLKVADVWAA